MGAKTSVIPQLDFLHPTLIKKCHRPTKLPGAHNIQAYDSLCAKGAHGITSEELMRERNMLYGTAGSCLVELRWLGLARKTEARRNGKAVYMMIGGGA